MKEIRKKNFKGKMEKTVINLRMTKEKQIRKKQKRGKD